MKKLFLVLFCLCSSAVASAQYYYPVILTLKTQDGKSYSVNLMNIDCSYMFPYANVCGPIPHYSGSATQSITINGSPVEVPTNYPMWGVFDLDNQCEHYARLYSPRCPRD